MQSTTRIRQPDSARCSSSRPSRLVDPLPLGTEPERDPANIRTRLGPATLLRLFQCVRRAGYDPDDYEHPEADDSGIDQHRRAFIRQFRNAVTVHRRSACPMSWRQCAEPVLARYADPVTADQRGIRLDESTPRVYRTATVSRSSRRATTANSGSAASTSRTHRRISSPTYLNALLAASHGSTRQPGDDIDPNVRRLERDNITNFSGGRLE